MSKNSFVFVFGINGIFACYFKHGAVKNISFFDIHSDKTIETIVHEVEDYLTIHEKVPVKIIIDGVGQSFVSKSVLKTLKAKELKQFLASKLNSDIKSTPNAIKKARLIRSDKSEKTNEYILSAISLDPSLQKVLDAIATSNHQIVSFHSSAAEMHDIATPTNIDEKGRHLKIANIEHDPSLTKPQKKQDPKTPDDAVFTYDASSHSGMAQQKGISRQWMITVGMLETSGLRITISVGNSIVLTRVKRIVGHSFNETSASIKNEIESVISYVEKSSTIPRSKLFMSVFGSRDFVSIIEAIAPDIGSINMFLMQDYIATTKNKTIAKEYNYPAVLTLAYKVYSRPFIEYNDDSSIGQKKFQILIKLITFASFGMFVVLNGYSILKFMPALKIKKNHIEIEKEQKKAKEELELLKKQVGNVDVAKNLAIAQYYAKKIKNDIFEVSFADVKQILSPFKILNIDNLSYSTTLSNTGIIKLAVYFEDQTRQDAIIAQIKNNDLGYDVTVERINQETGETILTFAKKNTVSEARNTMVNGLS